MNRPGGYSDDEYDDYDGFDDYDDRYDESDAESGYDEPATTTSIPLSESLQDAMSKCLLDEIAEIIPQIDDYGTFRLRNGLKPLEYAALLGKPELVEYFLQLDVDYQVSNSDVNHAPLTLACSVLNEKIDEDHLKCTEILLEGGADVNFKDQYGVNALMTACKNSTLDIVKLLLSSGAAINDCDNDGWSPIFYAVNRGERVIVEELLKYDARLDVMDKRKRYAYTIALEKEFNDIAELVKPEIVSKIEEASLNRVIVRGTTTLSEYAKEKDPAYYDDVMEMLSGVATDMERYAPLFRDKRISLYEFLLLRNEEDLKQIGIPLSWHRQTILNRIQQFHLSCWYPKSLGLCEYAKNEVRSRKHMMQLLTYLASLRQHLLVLKASLRYFGDGATKFIADDPNLVSSMKEMQSSLAAIVQRVKQLQNNIQTVKTINLPRLLAQQV